MTEQTAIIGASNGQPVALDVDRLVGGHAAIIANSGGGKSGLIRRILEQTHGRIQHVIIDPEDEFYTLRERYDYVIAGGDDGDIPATVEGAKALALGALQHGFSLIVQLNDLGSAADAFVAAFLNAMIHAPRDLWHPALVVIDEAQRFAPSGGTETPAARAVKALTAQGRKRGFTAVLASQRIAKIDANVRGDINNWMLGRVGQALDRNAMADQLGFSAREGRERLAGIADRHFWGFGPAVATEPILFRVADVETTPVRPGQAKVLTPPPAVALADILAGLVVDAPKVENDDATCVDAHVSGRSDSEERRRLRDRIGELERQLADTALLAADRAREIRHLRDAIEDAVGSLAPMMRDISVEGEPSAPETVRQPAPAREKPVAAPKPARAVPTGGIPASQQRVLDAIAWWGCLGFSHIERRRACVIAGLSPKASTFGVYISKLAQAGLVDVSQPGMVGLTDKGAQVANRPDGISKAQVVTEARAMLNPAAQGVFDRIVTAHPDWISRDQLADDVGLSRTASTLGVYISKAGQLGFVETKPGHVRASDWLFP